MRKLLLTLATTGLGLSAFAQGAVFLDTSSAVGWVDAYNVGNHYTGIFGLELWMKNGTAADDAINSLNGVWPPPAFAYGLLTADGFTLQTRLTGQQMSGGIFSGLGLVEMPSVDRTVNGGNAVLGLVIWAGNSGAYGVLTFVNPTADYTITPPYTPLAPGLDGLYTDLIIVPIPEPGIAVFAGLGAALLLVFRPRRPPHPTPPRHTHKEAHEQSSFRKTPDPPVAQNLRKTDHCTRVQ